MNKKSNDFLAKLIKANIVTLDQKFDSSRHVPYADLDKEIKFTCGESVDTVSLEDVNTGVETNPDITSQLKDAPNLVKMGMESMDKWTTAFTTIYSSNSNSLDVTGNFKKNPLYKSFVVPAMESLAILFDEKGSEIDDPYIAHIQKMHDLLCEQTTMNCISGGTKAPFLYEGFQLVFLETLHQTVLAAFVSVSKDISLEQVYEETKNKVLKTYFLMLNDICSDEHIEMYKEFGKSIIYNVPVNKDIDTGAIAETPYFKYKDIVELAHGENITNVTNIKNAGILDNILLLLDAVILTAKSLTGQSLESRYKFYDNFKAYMDEVDPSGREMKERELKSKYNESVTRDAEIRSNLEKEQDKEMVKVVF